MAIMNFALLALVPFVLARPQVGHGEGHKAFHGPHTAGTGVPGPFSHHHPKASGTAPFPVPGGNGTSGAATGSSGAPMSTGNGGPVYVTSTINVIPTPVTSNVYDSAAASGTGGAGGPGAGGPGAGNSNSPSQATGGTGGSGAGTACGPATVTITNANTVTVTVGPAGGAGQTGGSGPNGPAGASSLAPTIASSVYVPPVSSAPFPIGNSTAPVGSGTGTAVSGAPTYSAAAVQATSSSVPAAQPYIAAAEKYKPQQNEHPYQPQGPAAAPASSSSSAYVAPPAPSPSTPAPQAPASSTPPYVAPSSQAASSAPAPSSSSTTSTDNVGAKGVAYNTPAQASQISGLGWACNWGQTAAVTNPPFEFVPQLWGKKPGMTDSITANCAGAKACLFYNEPDMSLAVGGSGIDVNTAIGDFKSIMQPIQKAGSKVSTPCVANSDSDYMSTFLAAFPSGSIDIMCFHWYGSDISGLQGTVSTFKGLADQYGIKELWINEWAVQPAPSDLSSYTSYLDGAVTRYAYNMNDMAGSTGY